jgi:hypothetical protein
MVVLGEKKKEGKKEGLYSNNTFSCAVKKRCIVLVDTGRRRRS